MKTIPVHVDPSAPPGTVTAISTGIDPVTGARRVLDAAQVRLTAEDARQLADATRHLGIPVLTDYDTEKVIGNITVSDGRLYLDLHPGHEMTPEAVTDLLGGAGWMLLDSVGEPLKVRRARIVCWSTTTTTTGARVPRQTPEVP